jgi:hypothetical protein
MLPPTPKIEVQPDEVSMMTTLFSSKHVDTSIQRYPCDVDHLSGYDADFVADNIAMLKYTEIHMPAYDDTMFKMPTIWQCVKHAFTMPDR